MYISDLHAIPVGFLQRIKTNTLNFIASHTLEQLMIKNIFMFPLA